MISPKRLSLSSLSSFSLSARSALSKHRVLQDERGLRGEDVSRSSCGARTATSPCRCRRRARRSPRPARRAGRTSRSRALQRDHALALAESSPRCPSARRAATMSGRSRRSTRMRKPFCALVSSMSSSTCSHDAVADTSSLVRLQGDVVAQRAADGRHRFVHAVEHGRTLPLEELQCRHGGGSIARSPRVSASPRACSARAAPSPCRARRSPKASGATKADRSRRRPCPAGAPCPEGNLARPGSAWGRSSRPWRSRNAPRRPLPCRARRECRRRLRCRAR
jgi:hypothetical protein